MLDRGPVTSQRTVLANESNGQVTIDPAALRELAQKLRADRDALREDAKAFADGSGPDKRAAQHLGVFGQAYSLMDRHDEVLGALNRLLSLIERGIDAAGTGVEGVATSFEEGDSTHGKEFEDTRVNVDAPPGIPAPQPGRSGSR